MKDKNNYPVTVDFTETRSWFNFAGIANNLGKYMQDTGQLKPYRWGLNYHTAF